MPRPGIPPNLEAAILAESGKGRSQRDIEAWLRDVHGYRTTHVTIGKLLRRVRAEVGESTRAVAVSEVAPQVVGHIAGLNGVIERAKAIEEADGAEPAMKLKALDIQRKAHVDVLKIAGADSASDGVKALADLLRAAGE